MFKRVTLFSRFRTENRVFKKSLKKLLGFTPSNLLFYQKAIVHKSVCKDNGVRFSKNHNERLEFLGDAILDAIVADYLFSYFKNKDEGFLTKLRSKIVKRENLDYLSQQIGLDKMLQYRSNNNNHKHIYGNALEALIGAIYLDRGYKKAHKFVVMRLIKKHLDINKMVREDFDYKSKLIEWGQKHKKEILFDSYEKYTDINRVSFFSASVLIGEDLHQEGIGKSKKEAEQNAAEYAIKSLKEKSLI